MKNATIVPFLDLSIQSNAVSEEVRAGFDRVVAEASFILGPEVERFEHEFADFCGVKQVVGVGNGTDALELALRGAGISVGDEVVLPANTFVATAEAVMRVGAIPRLVDCDDNYLIDPLAVASAVSPRTQAVIGVHLYGQAAPMELLRKAAGEGVLLVEDAAQAQGACRLGMRAGALGDVAATSFYPGKNLGAYGDAGAVMTDSEGVANHIRALRNHGGTSRYEHLEVGINSRLDGLQAVVLTAKLAHLEVWNRARREAAGVYDELLLDVPDVTTPRVEEGNEHVFHLYVVRVPRRDEVMTELNEKGIGAAIHYPAPIHQLPAFSFLGYKNGDFPRAEQYSKEILSLPIFPGITRAQQELVVTELKTALGRG